MYLADIKIMWLQIKLQDTRLVLRGWKNGQGNDQGNVPQTQNTTITLRHDKKLCNNLATPTTKLTQLRRTELKMVPSPPKGKPQSLHSFFNFLRLCNWNTRRRRVHTSGSNRKQSEKVKHTVRFHLESTRRNNQNLWSHKYWVLANYIQSYSAIL